MTSSSGGSAELLTSGPPSGGRRAPGRRRLLGVVVALAAIGGGVAVVRLDLGRDEAPPVTYVEQWIDAWNDRDAQAVSSMTCDYRPAFTPAGIIETYLRGAPPDGPVVADHLITGTEDSVAYDRPAVRVRVTYLRAGHEGLLETSVFVRVREDGDMCIGAFTNW
jgi:hypothetical protein